MGRKRQNRQKSAAIPLRRRKAFPFVFKGIYGIFDSFQKEVSFAGEGLFYNLNFFRKIMFKGFHKIKQGKFFHFIGFWSYK